MKVKLLRDIPVDPKHGLTKDREIEVMTFEEKKGYPDMAPYLKGLWVIGDNEEPVKLQTGEYEAIDERPVQSPEDSYTTVGEGRKRP